MGGERCAVPRGSHAVEVGEEGRGGRRYALTATMSSARTLLNGTPNLATGRTSGPADTLNQLRGRWCLSRGKDVEKGRMGEERRPSGAACTLLWAVGGGRCRLSAVLAAARAAPVRAMRGRAGRSVAGACRCGQGARRASRGLESRMGGERENGREGEGQQRGEAQMAVPFAGCDDGVRTGRPGTHRRPPAARSAPTAGRTAW